MNLFGPSLVDVFLRFDERETPLFVCLFVIIVSFYLRLTSYFSVEVLFVPSVSLLVFCLSLSSIKCDGVSAVLLALWTSSGSLSLSLCC